MPPKRWVQRNMRAVKAAEDIERDIESGILRLRVPILAISFLPMAALSGDANVGREDEREESA